MRTRRGFILVVVLMLSVIMFILGAAMLSQRVGQYRAATSLALSFQAQAIAQAGLEDAHIKLAKDPDFPPQGSQEQLAFTYSEVLNDASGNPVGSYTVTVDKTYAQLPYAVILVTSQGVAGNVTAANSTRRITAELDISPVLRDGSGSANPNYFQWTNWIDSGSF